MSSSGKVASAAPRLRSQRTVSELQSDTKRGLSFEDFKAYRNRCMEPKKYLDPDHYFYDFNLQSHNANAEQVEQLKKKRMESETPKLR